MELKTVNKLSLVKKTHKISKKPTNTDAIPKYVIETSNQFSLLEEDHSNMNFDCENTVIKKIKKLEGIPKNKENNGNLTNKHEYQNTRIERNFQSKEKPIKLDMSLLEIYGDSHSRGLSLNTRELIDQSCVVTGVCKPSARLLKVLPQTSTEMEQAPKNPDCIVILGGSNDVAAGKQADIYANLDEILTLHQDKKVIMSTNIAIQI